VSISRGRKQRPRQSQTGGNKMDNVISNAVEAIAKSIGVASNEIIPYYVKYYTISAISYIILGLIMCFLGCIVFKNWLKIEDKDDGLPIFMILGSIIMFFIGCLFVFVNLPDIFSPEAMAYHRLIRDLSAK
jgi:putative Mn2+ efflux pump MntP